MRRPKMYLYFYGVGQYQTEVKKKQDSGIKSFVSKLGGEEDSDTLSIAAITLLMIVRNH